MVIVTECPLNYNPKLSNLPYLKSRVKRTLYGNRCPYFSPQVLLKFIRVRGYFVKLVIKK